MYVLIALLPLDGRSRSHIALLRQRCSIRARLRILQDPPRCNDRNSQLEYQCGDGCELKEDVGLTLEIRVEVRGTVSARCIPLTNFGRGLIRRVGNVDMGWTLRCHG